MDKASDFGSEDCRFESCHGRSTYIFLCLVFSQNYYKIVTNIYLIIYWWMNCKRHKHKILSGSQCTYSIETPQPSMRSLALENSKHDDYSPIVMINFADSFWANKCVCTYYVCVCGSLIVAYIHIHKISPNNLLIALTACLCTLSLSKIGWDSDTNNNLQK